MLTVILTNGRVLEIEAAAVKFLDEVLVCVDSTERRVVAFDKADVRAFAQVHEGRDSRWQLPDRRAA
jgi:hypothetical protein